MTGFTDSVSRTSAVLDLVHSDIVGRISPPSIAGAEYFVTFMDDYSGYSEVKILKKKSDVAEAFKQYQNRHVFRQSFGLKRCRRPTAYDTSVPHKSVMSRFHFRLVRTAILGNGKFSSRVDECVFLGFQEGIKGFRLWRLSDKKIIVSTEMRFYEHVFPFKTPGTAKPLVHEQENVVEIPAVEKRNENE
ncbi:hypothetical protein PR048_001064 [Dryococelus australis]|uniref:Retroviral polymerase SH3-like domain-containing protein n=1 Tax=Dryococelus australis TaxID=614101 RepID=A0ABQ9IGE7_9NEOP|nr:hypothetical protein PR048_001064 [Dryococelus australis]